MSLRRIVYFVRHGERQDLLQAEKEGLEDPSLDKNALLSDLGKTQAFVTGMSIAKNLRPILPHGGKVLIMSSPYLRCLQTSF